MILEDIDRFINPDQIINRVVYDLDAVVSERSVSTELGNDDEQRSLADLAPFLFPYDRLCDCKDRLSAVDHLLLKSNSD